MCTKHLVCVEPDTNIQFTIDLQTGSASLIHINDTQLQEQIRTKIKREEYKLNYILNRDVKEEEWEFNNEAVWNYRCQQFPIYLLQQE